MERLDTKQIAGHLKSFEVACPELPTKNRSFIKDNHDGMLMDSIFRKKVGFIWIYDFQQPPIYFGIAADMSKLFEFEEDFSDTPEFLHMLHHGSDCFSRSANLGES